MKNACDRVGKECTKDPQAYYDHVLSVIKPALDERAFLPKLPIRRDELETVYPFLRSLWSLANAAGKLDFVEFSEWDYLKAQLDAPYPNLWAALRLSLLMEGQRVSKEKDLFGRQRFEIIPAFHEISHRLGFTPNSAPGGMSEKWTPLLNTATTRMPLDEVPGLRPLHVDGLLTMAEKKKIWGEFVEKNDEGNNFILRQRRNVDGDTFYSLIARLSDRTLLRDQDVEAAIREFAPSGDRAGSRLRRDLEEYRARAEAKDASFWFSLYLARGNPERQRQLALEHAKKQWEDNGRVDVDPSSEDYQFASPAEALLQHDLDHKKILYRQLISEGALNASLNARKQARELCAIDPIADPDNFKRLVYSTMKVQSEILARLGLEKLPPEAQEYLDKWFQSDKTQLQVGLLQGGLTIGAFLFTMGSCVVAFCVPALVLGVAAVGTGAYLAKDSIDDKLASEERESFAKASASLGLTDRESVDKYRNNNYGYTEAIANVLFTLPLLGVTAKAGQLTAASTSAFTRTAIREGLLGEIGRQAGLRMRGNPQAWREAMNAVKAAANDVNIKIAMYWVGLRSVSDDLATGVGDGLWAAIRRELLETPGQRTTQRVLATAEEINSSYAKQVAKHFRGGDEFANELRSYAKIAQKAGAKSERWVGRRATTQAAIEADPDSLVSSLRRWKYLRYPQWRINQLKKKFAKLDAFEAIADKVQGLSREAMETYIRENADEVGNALTEIFFRKHELAFYMFQQGVPMPTQLGSLTLGPRGVLLKEMSNARELLLFEKARADLALKLGFTDVTALIGQNANGAVIEFRNTLIVKGHGDALESFESQISEGVLRWTRQDGAAQKRLGRLPSMKKPHTDNIRTTLALPETAEDIRRILFMPESVEEEVLSAWLWRQIPKELYLGSTELQRVSTQMVDQLGNYGSAQDFDNYWDALRMYLTLKPNTPLGL